MAKVFVSDRMALHLMLIGDECTLKIIEESVEIEVLSRNEYKHKCSFK